MLLRTFGSNLGNNDRTASTEGKEAVSFLWQDALILFLLTATYVAGYGFSAAVPDTTRDVFAAYEISKGHWLPLEGPIYGGAIHLGPIWYYLLAIPLFIVRSWVAVVLFAGAIASLKFWLAYLCGRRLLDRNFALIWASCLALPGWTTLEQVTLFNPNLTEAAVLAVLFLNITLWQRYSPSVVFILGVACGFAVHSHPTTLVALPLSLVSAVLASPHPARLRTTIIFLGGCALLFLPYASSQVHSGFADLGRAGDYISGNVSLSQLFNAPAILYAALIAGPLQIGSYLLHPSTVWVYNVVFAAVGAASLIGVIRGVFMAPHRPLLIGIAVVVCVLTVEVAFLRAKTPFYFVYTLIPFLSALTALGLWHFGHILRLRSLSLGVAIVAVSTQLLIVSCLSVAMQNGVGTFSDISDIVKSTKSAPYTDIWFPAYAHDARGDFFCAHGDRISVHGPLAYLLERNLNVDALIRCDRNPSLELSGEIPRDRLHVTGLPRIFWEALHAMPTCWLGPIGITHASQVLWPPSGIAQVSPRTYFPRPWSSGPLMTTTVTFDALSSEAVVMTNVVFGYTPWEIESVEANGSKIEPTLKTEMSRLYVSQVLPTVPAVHWKITLTTPDTNKIDIATVSINGLARQGLSSCNSATAWSSLTSSTR